MVTVTWLYTKAQPRGQVLASPIQELAEKAAAAGDHKDDWPKIGPSWARPSLLSLVLLRKIPGLRRSSSHVNFHPISRPSLATIHPPCQLLSTLLLFLLLALRRPNASANRLESSTDFQLSFVPQYCCVAILPVYQSLDPLRSPYSIPPEPPPQTYALPRPPQTPSLPSTIATCASSE
jgi:hypothetical protein